MQKCQVEDSSDDSSNNLMLGDLRGLPTLEEKAKQRKKNKKKQVKHGQQQLISETSPGSSYQTVSRQRNTDHTEFQPTALGGMQGPEIPIQDPSAFWMRQPGDEQIGVGQPDQRSFGLGTISHVEFGAGHGQPGSMVFRPGHGQPGNMAFRPGHGQPGNMVFGMGDGQPGYVPFATRNGQPAYMPFPMGQGQLSQVPFVIGQGRPGQAPFATGQRQLCQLPFGQGQGQRSQVPFEIVQGQSCQIPAGIGESSQDLSGMGPSTQIPVGMDSFGYMPVRTEQQRQNVTQFGVMPSSMNGYQQFYANRASPYQFTSFPSSYNDSTNNNLVIHPNWAFMQMEDIRTLREQVSFLQNMVLQHPTSNTGGWCVNATAHPTPPNSGQPINGEFTPTLNESFQPEVFPSSTITRIQTPFSDRQIPDKDKKCSRKKVEKKKKSKKLSKTSCKLESIPNLSSSDDSDDHMGKHGRRDISKRGRPSTYNENAAPVTFINPTIESKGDETNQTIAQGDQLSVQKSPLQNVDADKEREKQLMTYKNAANNYQQSPHLILWNDVANARKMQQVIEEMDMITVVDKFIIKRGSESYVVGNKRKRNYQDPAAVRLEADLAAAESKMDYATDSTVSSACFSDSTKDYIKGHSKAMKSTRAQYSVHENGIKNGDRNGQQLMKEALAKVEDEHLPRFISNTLREKRSKLHLFVRAMKIFGRKFMETTFLKTLKVERLGGIMIKNMCRRRTPGGTFIYMLRTDERLKQADRDAVFEYDRTEALEIKRADKRYQKQMMYESMRSRMKASENCENEINVQRDSDSGMTMDVEKQTTEDIFKEEEILSSYPILKNLSTMTEDCRRPLITYSDLF